MIKIYLDSAAQEVFIGNSNGVKPVNSLQAVAANGLVTIKDLAKSSGGSAYEIVTGIDYTEFVQQDGVTPHGADLASTVNSLNAVFTATGSADTAPSIESAQTVQLQQGDSLNYTIAAPGAIAYEWLNLPAGVTTVDGRLKQIIGGSALSTGTYTPTMTAINHKGFDSRTLTINVVTPPFTATKSVAFNNDSFTDDYADAASPGNMAATLGRTTNGDGNAWTISFYIKASSATGGRTIMYLGSSDKANVGGIELRLNSTNKLRLRYGSNNNYIQRQASTALTAGQWQHVLITFDGGTTGSSSADLSDYYSRFRIYIDDTETAYTNAHSNFGYTSAINTSIFELGRYVSSNPLDGERLCHFAVWGSNQAANKSAIYNSGSPHNLNDLTPAPANWWRMGNGDTFPTLSDSSGSTPLTMRNMNIGNIVTDSP